MLGVVIPGCGSEREVAGILLTGGFSRRMGFDKASMEVDGVPCAVRVGNLLRHVVSYALEIGPGISGLPSVQEETPGCGPLVAICKGVEVLRAAGIACPTLVVACDLPLLSEIVLRTLAQWPGTNSVVPVVEGHPQPLCARWSMTDLCAALMLTKAGARSMRSLLERPEVELVDELRWPGELDRRALADVDTPADLERLGLLRTGHAWQRALAPGPSSDRRPSPPPEGPKNNAALDSPREATHRQAADRLGPTG